MSSVIVIGSANTDLTVKADRLPRPGETLFGDEFMVSYGGKGANQALAALNAGASVTLVARIGTDTYGNRLFKHLVRSGLPPEGLLRDSDHPAGLALIALDKAGNNQIIVVPGSNSRLSVDDVRSLEPVWKGGSVFLTQLESPLQTVEFALRLARGHGMTTILDPAPAGSLPEAMYRLIDILTPNDVEAGSLSGVMVKDLSDAEKAASILRSKGCAVVIVTMGARGALLSSAEGVRLFPAMTVWSIDTVAAGDAFNGALTAVLAEGRMLSEAVRFATAAAALSTTKRGAQESLPTRKEIDKVLDTM
jgi:ribokinase